MRVVLRLLLFGALFLIVNTVTSRVIGANFAAGVYPPDADSIGMPLMEVLFVSVLSLVMLLPLLLLSAPDWSVRKAAASRAWRWTLGFLLPTLYLWNLLLQVNWAVSWLDPHHYLIGASIGLVPIALLGLAILDFRRFRTAIVAARKVSAGP